MDTLPFVVGRHPTMQRIAELTRKVAETDATVLITGESGTGKELVARAIHALSARADRPFIPVNCAAIPADLLESELFGHERGAFTGAVAARAGMFQLATGGSIFLDEVGEMGGSLQVRLLRVLQDQEVRPVGADRSTRVDVRVIAATNRDLGKAVEEGQFRDDLYYRLNVIGIDIPPLRERREDIPPLVQHFITIHNRELRKGFKGADGATMKVLLSLPWKGNVRELDTVIEHAMILGDGDWITIADLPRALKPAADVALPVGDDLREALRTYEKAHIQGVLTSAEGDKRLAAERLGVSLSSLYRKIEELGIGIASAPPL
jgi:transcriptional regulator with PAS, ATPase and Fis domain